MAKNGRPEIQIDKQEFEKLCGLHATLVEMAGWFDCSEDTIERWCERTYEMGFAEIFKRKSGKGKVSLRRKQFESAMHGNVTMQIWLGKQQLGQKDNAFVDLSVQPIKFNYSTEDEGK
jgi:hypothetical protein